MKFTFIYFPTGVLQKVSLTVLGTAYYIKGFCSPSHALKILIYTHYE